MVVNVLAAETESVKEENVVNDAIEECNLRVPR